MTNFKIVGFSGSITEDGRKFTTIHAIADFEDYYQNPESGRFCDGQQVEKINAGSCPCDHLKVGMTINVCYGKAINTKNGVFQRVEAVIPVTAKN